MAFWRIEVTQKPYHILSYSPITSTENDDVEWKEKMATIIPFALSSFLLITKP